MRNFLCMIMAFTVVMQPVYAHAQAEDDLDSGFASYRDTLEKAALQAQAAPNVARVDDLLGPAADLPVSGVDNSGLVPTSPEELQALIENEAENQENKLKDEAFMGAIRALMPLEPAQIRRLYEEFVINREAAETPIRLPELKSRVETVSLDPGQAPPVIRLAPDYVTTISILDSSGSPWPIQDLSYTGKFEVTPPEDGGHILRITPSSAHDVGNVSIRMVDLVTPVFLVFKTGLDEVDYRYDLRIARNGPLAKTPLIEYGGLSAVAGTDQNLTSVLDGTLPASAEKLSIQGTDGRTSAYRLNGVVYLRTPLTLLSPAWESSVASADGTRVYMFQDSPVVLLSDQGQMVRINISAADEVLP